MSDVADQGGDPPCWAHLFDEDAEGATARAGDTLLAQLVRGTGDAVVIADVAGRITFWNDAATRIFGWSAAEAVGGSLDLIIPERQRGRHWTGYEATMATGTTRYGDSLLQVPALRADGSPCSIAFTVTLLRDDAGALLGIAAVIRDETERWLADRALRARLRELEAAAG